jgi:hypothetical protein
MRFKYGLAGKTPGFSLYAGYGGTEFPLGEVEEYGIATAFASAFITGAGTDFNIASFAGLFTPAVTGLTCDVFVKMSTTREVIRVPSIGAATGTRSTTGLDQRLPLQNTFSAYAPRLVELGRGAKVAIAEAFEADWGVGGWTTTNPTLKWALVDQFLIEWPNFVSEVGTSILDTVFFPVVVPRLKLPKEDEGYDYRLPYEAGDIPNATQVGAFSVSGQAGTKDKLSPRLR